MKFCKMQGAGNDFIVIKREEAKHNLSNLAIKLCDRHFGIGADGLIIVEKSKLADFKMRIFNPNGSEAEMCGNGVRCFAKYVFENKLTRKKEFSVETLAGIIKPQILNNGEVKVNMGNPRLKRKDIPVLGNPEEEVINSQLVIRNSQLNITCVSFGNPHCVIFVDDFKNIEIGKLGPQIETNPLFPRRTNVEFVKVKNKKNIEVKVWERGVGETLACGTGACASVVAGVLNNKAERKVQVILAGGKLNINWCKKDNNVYLQGEAKIVFAGEIKI